MMFHDYVMYIHQVKYTLNMAGLSLLHFGVWDVCLVVESNDGAAGLYAPESWV